MTASTFDRLVDNLTHADEMAGLTRISAHEFGSALHELADGAITRAQFEEAFDIAPNDPDINWLVATYQGKTNKIKFLFVIENMCILAENRLFNYNVKTTFAARLAALP